MKYTMLPNHIGAFAWSDVPDCHDIQTGRKIASQFTAIVFSEINASADLDNGDLTEVTMDCTLNDDLPEDWVSVLKNEDGTELIEIQAHPERACEECIHFFACSRQCGEPMAQSSATGCECYETIKSSAAYYVGTLDGAKGKIPNRLRELAEADRNHQIVIRPCKIGDTVWAADTEPVIPLHVMADAVYLEGRHGGDYERLSNFGSVVFLSQEEAKEAASHWMK